jgi:hypothetical protein
MHSHRWLVVLGFTALLLALLPALLLPGTAAYSRDQEPTPAPPAPAQPQSPPAASTSRESSTKSGKHRYSHANDFLIRGTVFTDKSLAFPGVKLRIRRAGEKKVHWETYTNSRGEFALRVPRGSEYEMLIDAKGFREQTRTINAKNGLSEDSVTFRMDPAAGAKK